MKIFKNLSIAVIVFISANCFSQSFMGDIVNRLHFGVKAGVNYSDFTNASFNTEGLTGFQAGVILGFRISDKFSIEEEFLYSQQGATLKGSLSSDKKIKLSYFAVPILLRYKMPVGLFFEAGPQVGILVDEDVKALSVGDDDFAKKIDAGAVGGIGYVFKSGFGINARYFQSFTDLSKKSAAFFNPNFQNNSVQFGLFYNF
ncbi:porin family protein [Chryseobacterium sp. C39-AII1]|uniref:porin family protein n=1 Tax=Chryseobacterium sp. C39-AII1 TaxID=3080332 RepID=UPI00320B366B